MMEIDVDRQGNPTPGGEFRKWGNCPDCAGRGWNFGPCTTCNKTGKIACPKCRGKNHLRARFCNECGASLPGKRMPDLAEGSSKLHVDVAHPINSECRNQIQKAILDAYHEEVKHADQVEHPHPAGAGRPYPVSEEPLSQEAVEDEAPEASAPEPEDDKPFGAGII